MNSKIKYSIGIAIILAVLFVALLCYTKDLKVYVDVPEWYEDVQSYMQEGNYNAVLNILESNEISEREKYDWWNYNFAVSLYKSHPMEVRYAIPLLEKAERWSRNDSAILYHLGKCFYEVGENRKAIEYFSRTAGASHNEWLWFSEKTSSEFWLVILNNIVGDYQIVDELILKNQKQNSEVDYLSRIRGGEICLKEICSTNMLPLEEKFCCIDFYFNTPDKYEKNGYYANECEKVIPYCDKETANYISAHLFYFYLASQNTKAVEKLLSTYGQYPAYSIHSDEAAVNELFYKHLCFYYWLKGDAMMANYSLDAFKYYCFKLIVYEAKGSDRLENISDFFGKTLDFENIANIKKQNVS